MFSTATPLHKDIATFVPEWARAKVVNFWQWNHVADAFSFHQIKRTRQTQQYTIATLELAHQQPCLRGREKDIIKLAWFCNRVANSLKKNWRERQRKIYDFTAALKQQSKTKMVAGRKRDLHVCVLKHITVQSGSGATCCYTNSNVWIWC